MPRRTLAPILALALVLLGAHVPRASARGTRSGSRAAPAGSRPSATAPADTGSTAVPTTFDWWKAAGIPDTTAWGQAVDTTATRKILSWTTEADYTTPLVDRIPVSDARSPSEHFGDPIGKPGTLHDVDQIYGYFRDLASSTPRVRFQLLGGTEEGRHLALVQVGSARNLARLDSIREGLGKLADPRSTSDAEAERLVHDLPVVYTFFAGLHSTETGPPEMVMELAYRLAASEDSATRAIRKNVVVFIIPAVEADGRERVVEWHRAHNAGVADYDSIVPGPPYWGHYIFHDDNRDGFGMITDLTHIVVDLALRWHFPIGHDLHESVPYLYTATGTGPYNTTVDPITITEWAWMANDEVSTLTGYGLPGVWTHGFYTGWYPGYMMWVTNMDLNGLGRFYETFGNSVPATLPRKLEGDITHTEWYRPSPPRDSTVWSLRNNTNYMESGALTALSAAAGNRERLLRDFWRKGKHSLEKGRTQKPYAWVVPADQARRADAAAMVENLREHGIEVSRATASGSFAGAGKAYHAPDTVRVQPGDYVLRMDQPYRNFLLTLMERQHFPADAPAPYDDVGWTYPLMYDVDAHAVGDSAVLALGMEGVGDGPIRLPASVERAGGADWWAVEPAASGREIRAWLALRRPGGSVPAWAAEDTFSARGRSFGAGTWLVPADSVDRAVVDSLAGGLGMRVTGLKDGDVRGVARHALDAPRIALLHTWTNTQDDGAVRYALDRMGVPYTYLATTDLAPGGRPADLRSRFDLVLMATQGSRATGTRIFQGVDPRWGPLPYEPTAEYPALGHPDSARDVTGGMGYEGLAALRSFVRGGGTLVTLGSASDLAVDMGLVRHVRRVQPGGLFVPGSIVEGKVAEARSPLTYGYPSRFPLYHQFGPYFRLGDELKGHAVVEYAGADSLFLSGLVKGGGKMAGGPAVVAAPEGEGTVVLFGFDPMHRFQPQGDFALVWNAIMNWNDLRTGVGTGG
ncbi:MAG TPA: M14 family zinc carboxypeptidase [Gemmatimonadota bacterium]|nr:M14 family zinc carboxypeptidase [Gemmatimonadota bacterium]